MTTNPNLDARAARTASRQIGLLTGTQARKIGFTQEQIDHRVETGRWRTPVRGIHVISGTPSSWEQEALAACLIAPPGSYSSAMTAGALWQRLCEPTAKPHITVPPSASARSPIAVVHRSLLLPVDVTRIGPIPVTRVPRTLVDLAQHLTPAALERAVDTALDRGQATAKDVLSAIERAQRRPGRRGVPDLIKALEVWTGPVRPGSAAEARLLRRLGEWCLPAPIRQHVVVDATGNHVGTVDAAWPDAKVGLEYDSPGFHGPRRFEHDEQRHAALEALGWRIEHVDRLDLRPGVARLPELLRGLLRRHAA
jgi:hypothetical protein